MPTRFALAFLAVSVLPAAAAQPFDGDWSMSAATQSGSCAAYTFNVSIVEGQMATPPGMISGSGSVSRSGAVAVNLTANGNAISGTGKAAGGAASGRWTSPTLGCAGTWQAQRR